jgi:2-isopropylmalate synthase
MALRIRADQFDVRTNIDTTKLTAVSRLVSRVTKSPVVRNKAVVGRNAFAHEAGIHQHGVMSDARTYEVMRPEDVGMDASELVLGKHSGRHAVDKRARELGYQFDSAAMMRIFAAFKRRADEIGALDDDELHALFTDGDVCERGWSLTRLEARTDKTGRSRAVTVVELARDNESTTHVAIGETALEAAFLALREASGEDAHVVEIEVMQAGYGATPDAAAETTVNIGGRAWAGHGHGPDPLWAGVRAFLDAFNKAARAKSYCVAPWENYNEAAG